MPKATVSFEIDADEDILSDIAAGVRPLAVIRPNDPIMGGAGPVTRSITGVRVLQPPVDVRAYRAELRRAGLIRTMRTPNENRQPAQLDRVALRAAVNHAIVIGDLETAERWVEILKAVG